MSKKATKRFYSEFMFLPGMVIPRNTKRKKRSRYATTNINKITGIGILGSLYLLRESDIPQSKMKKPITLKLGNDTNKSCSLKLMKKFIHC